MLDRYDQDLLLDYLEGELDAGRRAQLDTMLAEDPELAALLNEMANDRAALRSIPQAEAPGDLVHDVTQTLERRMLLDDSVDDTAPIPMSRAMAAAPTRSISWGRVVGLTGLAASVALAAGILVITLDDPLQRTANELADNSAVESEEITGNVSIEADEAVRDEAAEDHADTTVRESLTPPAVPGGVPESIADPATPTTDTPTDESFASGGDGTDPRRLTPEAPAAVTEPTASVLGPTAAIGALQPRQQLVLFTDAPEVSRDQLVAFCVANGIPVVQPDPQAELLQQQFNDEPGLALDNASADAVADEPIAEYALLINESQLDTLVQRLNNDVAIEPKRVGKGSLFSNQAALLTEYPEPSDTEGATAAARSAVEDSQPGDDVQAEFSQNIEQAPVQQAVQLRSPDLGSDYKNTRNAYNLKAQQRGDYGQQTRAVLEEQEAASPTPTEAQERQLTDPAAELSEAEKPKHEDKEDQADSTPLTDQDTEAENAATPGERSRDALPLREATPGIDPTRGNWLSAHLPVADTAPLLLSWREGQSAEPTKLVPVMIRRAEPDKVNTLRLRQQSEYANRDAPRPADADAAEAIDAADEREVETPATNVPAEAEPAEPAE